MSTAAVIVVGNEILNGSTTDTNSGWVCRQVSGRGSAVTQIMTVPDVTERIITALQQISLLKPDLIITLGGLGPTRDDLTVSAIAAFAELSLETNAQALEIVNQRYAELAAEGRISDSTSDASRQAREKMALFPSGGEALFNNVGAAPALHLDLGEYAILALPGVPRELKSIVQNYATDVFEKWLGSGAFRSATIVTSTNDESSLAGVLSEFDEQSDESVYLKSRAHRFGSDVKMELTLAVRGSSATEVDEALARYVEIVRSLLEGQSIAVLEVSYDA